MWEILLLFFLLFLLLLLSIDHMWAKTFSCSDLGVQVMLLFAYILSFVFNKAIGEKVPFR